MCVSPVLTCNQQLLPIYCYFEVGHSWAVMHVAPGRVGFCWLKSVHVGLSWFMLVNFGGHRVYIEKRSGLHDTIFQDISRAFMGSADNQLSALTDGDTMIV